MFATSVLMALAFGGTGATAGVAMPEQPPQLPKSPSIVVHTDRPLPANTADRRVDVGGGVRVSTGPGVLGSGASSIAGAIPVPDNTMGPGEPLWVRRELANAAVRYEEARATLAQREAERAYPRHDSFGYGSGEYFTPGVAHWGRR